MCLVWSDLSSDGNVAPRKIHNITDLDIFKQPPSTINEHRDPLIALSRIPEKVTVELQTLIHMVVEKSICTENGAQDDHIKQIERAMDRDKQNLAAVKLTTHIVGLPFNGISYDVGVGSGFKSITRRGVMGQLHDVVEKPFEAWHSNDSLEYDSTEFSHPSHLESDLEHTSHASVEEVESDPGTFSYLVEQYERECQLQVQAQAQEYEQDLEASLSRYLSNVPSSQSHHRNAAEIHAQRSNTATPSDSNGSSYATMSYSPARTRHSSGLDNDSDVDHTEPAWAHINTNRTTATRKRKLSEGSLISDQSFGDKGYFEGYTRATSELSESVSSDSNSRVGISRDDIASSAMRIYDIKRANDARKLAEVMLIGEVRFPGCD